MRSTMQDIPLTVTRLLTHGAFAHGTSRITTWAGTAGGAEPDRRSFLQTGLRAVQLAGALHDAFGVEPGDRVATLMANTADHLEAYLAVPSMGAVLHTLDPWLPADQLVAAARHGGASVLITDPTGLAPLASVLPRLGHLRHVVVAGGSESAAVVPGTAYGAEVHDYESLIADRRTRYEWPALDERDAAVLCHTTAADAAPRGVAYSHRALYLHALQAQTPQAYGIGEHDLVLPVVPMSRMLAWGLPYAAFACGASLLLPGTYDQPVPLARMAERERPTLAVADPATWEGLLDELAARPRDLSCLREAVVVGGPREEPGGPLLAQELGRRHGISAATAWGAPETLSPACMARAEAGGVLGAGHYRFPAPVEYGVLGPDLAPLPWDGESQGELLLRGPWITACYVESAEPEVPSASAPPPVPLHEGWLRTGETAVITPDGRVAMKPPKEPSAEGL